VTELCRNLRWKSIIGIDRLDPAQLEVMYRTADAQFSCLGTCDVMGPDQDLVAPESCQPGRGCFDPSPRLQRRAIS
jgi:hypothetical protein